MNSEYLESLDPAPSCSGKAFYLKAIGSLLVGVLAFTYAVLEASEGSIERFFADSVEFSGRLHPQFEYLESSLEGTNVDDPETTKRDFMRRVLAGVKVSLSDRTSFYYLTDLSDRVVKNQVVRLEVKTDRRNKWHFGYQKAPFGFEDTTSSGSVKPIERSPNTRFWNDVLGLGTYHAGVYQYHDFGDDFQSIVGLTHNVMGDSKIPDLFRGEVSLYGRLSKKGVTQSGLGYHNGLDLAYQQNAEKGDMVGASFFSNLSIAEYDVKIEATVGDIELASGKTAHAYGWHAQISRMFGERLEWVGRACQVNTGGYQAKISSLIRKAPYSGFRYQSIDSLYFGLNYYLQGNDLKLSAGYELGKGDDALSGLGPLDSVEESVSGFRVRGQINF